MNGDRRCPYCRALTDTDSRVGDGPATPKVGDVSICVYCAGVSTFSAYGLSIPPSVELAEMLANPTVEAAVKGIRRAIEAGLFADRHL